MPPFLTLLGLLKWPATVFAAVLVFGTATNSALSMLHANIGRPAQAATINANLATPLIHMPDTPVVSAAEARARLSVLPDGRRYALAALAADAPAAAGSDPARMIAASGLVVRAKPMKASAAVGTIARGESVEVRSKQGGWLLVSGPAGQTGWVFGKYLKPAAG
jgi:uncharacterized protein YgiM (DUF1202 family)